jgi:hypothetical protein
MNDVHKYQIGEELRFRSAERRLAAVGSRYRVVGYRPSAADGEPSYRIKSDDENHERIAAESELS